MVIHCGLKRTVSSGAAILVSYPLETYKVHKLANKTLLPGTLFSGVEAPLIMNSVALSLRMYIFEHNAVRGIVLAGCLAGIANAGLSIPVESYKISKQLGTRMTSRGWYLIVAKEILGSVVYLSSIRHVRNLNANVLVTGGYGGLCGMLATTCVYPLDSLRIRLQNGRSVRQIIEMEPIATLWLGYKYSLYKAFVQSAVMVALLTLMN